MAQVKYTDILEEAWQQHLAPKEANAPTVISTFAGYGGSSLGYSMAGFRELLAVEWDWNAVDVFKLNFPDVPIYCGDICKLSVDECLHLAKVQFGELDVLDSSPPCQGFSMAGKRKLDDPRNQLFGEYVRLLRGLQPKVFLMENVSGLVRGKMKLIFAQIMRALKKSGYKVRCKLLNTMYFNVPQSRNRLIWIGIREDLGRDVVFPLGNRNKINGTKLLPRNLQSLRFLSWRNKNRPDNLRPLGSVPVGIGQTGVDMEGRYILRDPFYVKQFQSFPEGFLFTGGNTQKLRGIGNSVPPLFMRALAQHIRQEILNKQGGES